MAAERRRAVRIRREPDEDERKYGTAALQGFDSLVRHQRSHLR